MWGRKKQEPVAKHVETDAEYWQKRADQRNAQAQASKAAKSDDGDCWDGYPPITLTLSTTELAELYSYELSAYNDTVGYYADGIQRVSPLPRRK